MVQVEGELAKRTTRPLIVYTETLIESGRVRVDCISLILIVIPCSSSLSVCAFQLLLNHGLTPNEHSILPPCRPAAG